MRKNTSSRWGNRRSGGIRPLKTLPFLTVVFLALGHVEAQNYKGTQLVRAELISAAENTNKPITVGIHFIIQRDWYLYWKNPGDAGLPIEVTWELPEGWKAGKVEFPIPEKFDHEDIIAYGYKKEVVLISTITPVASATGLVKAKLDWLVCRESCVRGGAEVTLDLRSGMAEMRQKNQDLISRFRNRLPGTQSESGVLIEKTVLSQKGEDRFLTVKLGGSRAADVIDFYPEITDGILVIFSGITVRNAEVIIPFTRQEDGLSEATLRGLFITRQTGFECSIPIQF